ncbi:MAG: hypothetical protein EZS28_025900, partial [Streblomastix strix]
MHQKGLIHRDIKGQNILLHSPPGSGRVIVKIADLGLIKVQKKPLQSTKITIAGTIPYQPPEMIMGNEDDKIIADAKIDVWSSGIILHQLVSHCFPFKSTNLQAIMMFMFYKKLERPPQVKDDIMWDLLTKMLAFDRKDRISASDALKHEFFTGEQAMKEISQEVQNLALAAQTAKKQGDQSITYYDTNTLFIVPESQIKQILSIDPEDDNTQIQSPITKPSPLIPTSEQQITSQQQQERYQTNVGCSRIQPNVVLHESSSTNQSIQQIPQIKEEQQSQEIDIIIDYKKLVEILKIPLKGNKEQKINIQKQQENELLKIICKFKNKEDNEGRTDVINSGLTEELSDIFESRDLSIITPPYIEAFLCVSFPYPWELRNQIYIKKNPYPGLFRLFDHQENEVVLLAIRSFGSILLCGLLNIQDSEPNIHFESIELLNRINKLFSLFKETKDKQTKDASSICIGRLFHAKEISDINIQKEVITHLKSIISDTDKCVKVSSIDAISYLALNQENYIEIMKGIDLKSIAEELRNPFRDSLEQKKEIQSKQEEKCNLLNVILEGRNDDELRKTIINSGIVDSLFFIFDTRDLSSITAPYVDVIQQLTLGSDEVRLLLYSKKPYPYLLRLLNHSDNEVLEQTINSINNILLAGSNTTPSSSKHP